MCSGTYVMVNAWLEMLPAEEMTFPTPSTMSTGETTTAQWPADVSPIAVNDAVPKLARYGWAGFVAVGSSSIHSADAAGPV